MYAEIKANLTGKEVDTSVPALVSRATSSQYKYHIDQQL